MNQKLFTYLALSLLWVDFTNSMDHKAEGGNNKQSETPSIDIWDQFSSDSESDTDGSQAPAAAAAAAVKKPKKIHKTDPGIVQNKDCKSQMGSAKDNKQINAPKEEIKAQFVLTAQIPFNIDKDFIGALPREINRVIRYCNNPEAFPDVPFRSCLLYGERGTAKSSLARGIAKATNRNLITCSGSSFLTEYQASGVTGIQKLFNYAKSKVQEHNKNIILVIDEIDALVGNRSGEQNAERKNMVVAFMNELDTLLDANNASIFVIGTTNFELELDMAVQSRQMTVKIESASQEQRKNMFTKWLNAEEIGQDTLLDYLASHTVGFNGRDIRALIANVRLENTQNSKFTENSFVAEIATMKAKIEKIIEANNQKKETERMNFENLKLDNERRKQEAARAAQEEAHRKLQFEMLKAEKNKRAEAENDERNANLIRGGVNLIKLARGEDTVSRSDFEQQSCVIA